METPDITCVIPTFNDRKRLPRAVQSVLEQPGVNVEVLLIDDCSDGPTREFIERLAADDSRIRAVFLSRNGGQAQARNIGGALARARRLTFLDQDDEHTPGWYRYALEQLEVKPALAAISGRARVVDLPARLGVDDSDLRLRGLSLVFVTNIVFRTSVFRASGGFPTAPLWRSPIAGEDGVYRTGLARNWPLMQCEHPAVIHHAREGGATVYFLDRSEVREDRVVITRFEDIESNGELHAAQEAFWAQFAQGAQELRICAPFPPAS